MANAIPVRTDPAATGKPAEPVRNPVVIEEDELLKDPLERADEKTWADLKKHYREAAIYHLPGGSYVPGTKQIREDR